MSNTGKGTPEMLDAAATVAGGGGFGLLISDRKK